jgi:hypothetical protein
MSDGYLISRYTSCNSEYHGCSLCSRLDGLGLDPERLDNSQFQHIQGFTFIHIQACALLAFRYTANLSGVLIGLVLHISLFEILSITSWIPLAEDSIQDDELSYME